MKKTQHTKESGLKWAIVFLYAVVMMIISTACHTIQLPRIASDQPDTLQNPDCGVEAPPEPLIGMRVGAIPNFWDTAYRANRIATVYVRVDSLYNSFYRPYTRDTLLKRLDRVKRQMEQRYGLRVILPVIEIMERRLPYNYTNANNLLFSFASDPSVQSRPEPFRYLQTGANIGGSAYISRGSVTSAKYAVGGFGRVQSGDDNKPGRDEYCFGHELLHNLGLPHSHTTCFYRSQSGQLLPRLDSCWRCEPLCSPSPVPCTQRQVRMAGSWASYCHIWSRGGAFTEANYWLHPAARAVLNQSLFNSNLPSFSVEPPTNTPTITYPEGTTLSGATANTIDGDTTTRWVTTGASTIRFEYPASIQINSITVWSGFLSATWGSPIVRQQVFVDGVLASDIPNGRVRQLHPINRSGRVIEIRGLDGTNRWREIKIN